MSVNPEQKTVDALRDWLLSQLPAKVAAVNATRAPVIKSAYAGPFTVPSGAAVKFAINGLDPSATFTTVSLTPGARTATQVAAELTTGLSGLGVAFAVDSSERIYGTGTAPTSAESILALGGDDANPGSNVVFGWPPGGYAVVRDPLAPPTVAGVADGWPPTMDLGPGFWVILGDRESVPRFPDVRRDEHVVAIELVIVYRATNKQGVRDREAITSCARCVRELLLSDDGRRLGIASQGFICKVEVPKAKVPGKPFSFKTNTPNPLFDLAMMQLNVLVYEVP